MFESIIELIEKYDSIIINGHFNPDGDCFGSQMGLKELLIEQYPNKKIYVAGSGLPKFFSVIGTPDVISDDVFANSLIIVLDANDLSRMEDKRVFNGKAFLKIDHHINLNNFLEGPEVIDEEASSTCEMLVDLAKEVGWKVNKTCANALFLGMLTDSGRFAYSSDHKKMLGYASFLCEKGAEPKTIYAILNVVEERAFKLKTLFFNRYKRTSSGVIYIIFRYQEIKKYGYSSLQISNMVNMLGNVEGYPIWFAAVEGYDGRVKIEVRSTGLNVQPIMASVGGGGHRQAAGCTLDHFDEEQIMGIIDELDNLIINNKKESK